MTRDIQNVSSALTFNSNARNLSVSAGFQCALLLPSRQTAQRPIWGVQNSLHQQDWIPCHIKDHFCETSNNHEHVNRTPGTIVYMFNTTMKMNNCRWRMRSSVCKHWEMLVCANVWFSCEVDIHMQFYIYIIGVIMYVIPEKNICLSNFYQNIITCSVSTFCQTLEISRLKPSDV